MIPAASFKLNSSLIWLIWIHLGNTKSSKHSQFLIYSDLNQSILIYLISEGKIHYCCVQTFLTAQHRRASRLRLWACWVKGCSLPVGEPLGVLWARTHRAPVILGRFQAAASQRSALEFLRPKEISNWVMDMVTWTMRRQRRRSREKEGKRKNKCMKHNMCSLSISSPSHWPWLKCPKTNLSGNFKKKLCGVGWRDNRITKCFVETVLTTHRVEGAACKKKK